MAVEPFLGTRPQQGFIGTIVLQAIAVLTLVAIVFGKVQSVVNTGNRQYKTLPCYFSLFALAEFFQLVITVDALLLRNIIQLFGILLFHGAMIIFSALQIRQTKTALVRPGGACPTNCASPGSLWADVKPLLIAIPCILGASWAFLIWWTRALYFEFGWAIFHTVGANPAMKKMYQYYQVMICLLKFDFFCFIGLTMQLLILVIDHSSAEFGLTIAAIPVVLVLLFFCGVAVKREIKWLMTISLILMAAALSYFIFKFVRYYSPQTEGQYESTRNTLTVFTIVSFLLVFSSFAVGLRCFSDFDKGLRSSKVNESLAPRRKPSDMPTMGERAGSSYFGGEGLTPRMSIE